MRMMLDRLGMNFSSQKNKASFWLAALVSVWMIMVDSNIGIAQSVWLPTWTAAPQAGDKDFNNQTVRMIVRSSVGGEKVRVRISNAYGTESLAIGSAHVALRQEASKTIAETDRVLRFNGDSTVVIPPGSYALSDAAELRVPQLADLAVSIFVPHQAMKATTHGTGLKTTYISTTGDFSKTSEMPTETTTQSYYWLSDVYVEAAQSVPVIVAFGDSITDGGWSTLDANRNWPSVLAKLMLTGEGKTRAAVVNEGIGGNRVLHEIVSTNAMARFDRDVIEQPGASTVIVFEGINDIGAPYGPRGMFHDQIVTAADLIHAMQQLIERCHMRHIKVVGATLTPFKGAVYYAPEGEVVRQAFNQWIRTSGAFDAVIDFDKVIDDPANPGHYKSAYDCGDHLHPNDAGYEAMAHAAFAVVGNP
jgi:lysophospholipase L1-like esterase